MKIADLQNGQTVRARWGRAGREAPKWNRWQDVMIDVQRDRQQRVAIIGLRGVNWAEYGPDSFDARYRVFVVEDYYFEIEGLVP